MSKQLAANPAQAYSKKGRPPNPTTTYIAPRKRAYSVKESADELNISVAQTYVLLARRKLRGKKIGARLVILGDELDRFLASCPEAEFDMPSVTRGATQSQ
jgi:hypothetical protein